jgi:transposase
MQTAVDYKVKYEETLAEVATLKHQVNELKRLIFGSKHERFISSDSHPSQLSLDIQTEAAAQLPATTAKKIEYTRSTATITENKQDHPGRNRLPEHLERREIIIEPQQDTKGCKKIGEEVTEELEYEPGRLFVNRYVRPKYAKADNEGIVIAPMMERPLPKAIAGAGLLAQIAIDKYADHRVP